MKVDIIQYRVEEKEQQKKDNNTANNDIEDRERAEKERHNYDERCGYYNKKYNTLYISYTCALTGINSN